jgi:hypothetical protein
MYTIVVWDRSSPNFGCNAFVDKHGTGQVQVESLKNAIDFLANHSMGSTSYLILDPDGVEVSSEICLRMFLEKITRNDDWEQRR